MIASDRLLRWLCWALIGFVIVSAAATLTLSANPFATGVPDGTDFVDRLLIYRGDDQKIYPLVLIGSLATIGVFVLGAMLGPVLRRFAPAGATADVMAVVFIVGGVVGVTAGLINIGVSQAATYGYVRPTRSTSAGRSRTGSILAPSSSSASAPRSPAGSST